MNSPGATDLAIVGYPFLPILSSVRRDEVFQLGKAGEA